jgi:hypothetical protein
MTSKGGRMKIPRMTVNSTVFYREIFLIPPVAKHCYLQFKT